MMAGPLREISSIPHCGPGRGLELRSAKGLTVSSTASFVPRRSRPCLAGRASRFMARGVVILGLAGGSGCGYCSSGLYRENIRTVYIEMFQSKEFRRGIEFQLTEALRKQIDRSTPYRNAPKEKADTVITGEVLEWREGTLGRSFRTGQPRQTAASLIIRFRWQDMRTGKLLVDEPRFVTTVEYVPPVGETVFHARDAAVNKLANRVVEAMEAPW